ncbi:CMP-N-acetylneuraminic acid synthetase [Hoeflea phototrophica DFL-43]|jgi:CMP-N-acetylneuraminic acid synthetase|uniref:CMP-N-acetylneuraminic acid synthetase n=1 Tax=Hoeflea phototrophica (strain DSM 17068 / NCIMB 14078 / DFL-43) TaxID=411684 RepID=A9CZV2_HOEPD|nr:acylneuraminate cytidylyltransferase family protein [Hoeflea phototrophica]EDQ34854.1 CMP-N-acetylneuraminic acid synthetase [Hoeflea phototrophica DFL-43]
MKICVVAARSGSKELPDKNIKMFAGKPLLAHTVEQAKDSGIFDIIAVSSDSAHYLDIGREAGANLLIKRPAELATDTTRKPPVLRHALTLAEAEAGRKMERLFDLQPTSPLRAPGDILGAAKTLDSRPDLYNVVSVCRAKASPYQTLVEEAENGRVELSKPRDARYGRRQDLPTCYELNGSIYAWRRQPILEEMPALTEKTGFWLMADECNIDIDTSLDFAIAGFIARHHFGWPETR